LFTKFSLGILNSILAFGTKSVVLFKLTACKSYCCKIAFN
jgi:hypothetical protein